MENKEILENKETLKEVLIEAETIEVATGQALQALGVPKEIVDIEILEMPSKGVFGIGKKNAKIKATINFDPAEEVLKFLRELFVAMEIEITPKVSRNDENGIKVNLFGEQAGVVIGKQGATLDSLERILSLVVNKYDIPRKTVKLDAEGYRDKRRDTLVTLAKTIATRAKKSGKPQRLEPMNRRERRIIHTALEKDNTVYTKSQGEEPRRYITVYKK